MMNNAINIKQLGQSIEIKVPTITQQQKDYHRKLNISKVLITKSEHNIVNILKDSFLKYTKTKA